MFLDTKQSATPLKLRGVTLYFVRFITLRQQIHVTDTLGKAINTFAFVRPGSFWSILRPLVSDWTGGTYSKCSLLFRLILSKLCVLVLVICKVTVNKTWELGFVHQFIITDWGGSGFYWNSSVNLRQVKTYNPILQNPWITFSEGLFMSNANILLKFYRFWT